MRSAMPAELYVSGDRSHRRTGTYDGNGDGSEGERVAKDVAGAEFTHVVCLQVGLVERGC
jgi:hypothetical protein